MTEPATHQARTAARRPDYVERLRTPLWWYPAGLVVGALLGAEFAFIVPLWLTWLPITISLLAAVLVVWRLSSATIRVTGTELVAGDRTLPLSDITQAIQLTDTELRRVVGRHGDPLAYNFIRSWVGPGVQLVLLAPTNPLEPAGADATEQPDGDAHPGSEQYDEYEQLPRLPEPYWLLSSRRPAALIEAIRVRVSPDAG